MPEVSDFKRKCMPEIISDFTKYRPSSNLSYELILAVSLSLKILVSVREVEEILWWLMFDVFQMNFTLDTKLKNARRYS